VSQGGGQLAQNVPLSTSSGHFSRRTVSGAPKIRAMQLISQWKARSEAVTPAPWGISATTAISTLHNPPHGIGKDGRVHIQAGAGIVADSVPATEYQETINKASALFKAIILGR